MNCEQVADVIADVENILRLCRYLACYFTLTLNCLSCSTDKIHHTAISSRVDDLQTVKPSLVRNF